MAWIDKCTIAKQDGRRCTKLCSEELFKYSQGDLKICLTHLRQIRSQKRCDLGRIRLFGSDSEFGDQLAAKLDAFFKSHAPESSEGEEKQDATSNKKRKAEFPDGQTPLNECKFQLQQAQANVMRLQSDIQAIRQTTINTFGTAYGRMKKALSTEKAKVHELADEVKRLTAAAQGNAGDTERVKILQEEVSRLQSLINDLQDMSTPSYREATYEEQSEFTKQLEEADDDTNICKMIENFMDSLTVT